MNANCNKQDLHEGIVTTDCAARGNLMAVEAPTTLRRPNPNGDEKIPTGPPPNMGAAKKRFCQTLTARQCGSATTIRTPGLPHNFEQIRRRAQEIYRARRGITGMTLNDWLKAGQELKQELARETN